LIPIVFSGAGVSAEKAVSTHAVKVRTASNVIFMWIALMIAPGKQALRFGNYSYY
jgi:hypothetical protein